MATILKSNFGPSLIESSPYFNEEYSNSLLQELYKQRQCSSSLCDVQVCVEDQEIPAHRCILSASCGYFEAMFSSEMVESKASKIHMQGIKKDIMAAVIDFIYSGKVVITWSNVLDFLHVSRMLFLSPLTTGCCSFLAKKENLSSENCFEVHAIAMDYSCEGLLKVSKAFIEQNFEETIRTEGFLSAPVGTLKEIFSSDELDVSAEDIVLEALQNWIEHDHEARDPYLNKLLDLIRVPYLTLEKWKGNLQDLLSQRLLQGNTKEVLARDGYRLLETILVVGGCSDSFAHCSTFDYISERWSDMLMPELNYPKWRFTLGECKGQVVAIGNSQDDGAGPCVIERLSFDKSYKWEVLGNVPLDMDISIDGAEGICIDNRIYFVGVSRILEEEESNGVVAVSLEDYSTSFSQVLTARESHCLVSDGNGFYVIGGHVELDISVALSSVEYYNLENGTSQFVSSLQSPRCFASSVFVQGLVYVLGGYDGNSVLSSAEVYDPRTNEWRDIANMLEPRMKSCSALFSGKIYIVGGTSSLTGPILKTVECYDPETDSWESVGSLPAPRCDSKCCVVKFPYRNIFSPICPSTLAYMNNLRQGP